MWPEIQKKDTVIKEMQSLRAVLNTKPLRTGLSCPSYYEKERGSCHERRYTIQYDWNIISENHSGFKVQMKDSVPSFYVRRDGSTHHGNACRIYNWLRLFHVLSSDGGGGSPSFRSISFKAVPAHIVFTSFVYTSLSWGLSLLYS